MTTSLATKRIGSESFSRTTPGIHDLRAEEAVDANAFSALRRCALLEGCKWDSQVGDTDTLSAFPLVLKNSVWKRIATQAEQLATEAINAEEEILREPKLINVLGLPPSLCRVLNNKAPQTPSPGRVMRFDFHYTTLGWRISEANSDVPGGFTESSHFTTMMAKHFPRLQASGNPGDVWADALAAAAQPNGVVALLSAPTYIEDHQVVSFLAARLRERGCRPHLAKPEQITWRDGFAYLNAAWHRGPLNTIVRFYQAEWLSQLPVSTGWKFFFRGGNTPVTNPAQAIISESKRFPLVWEKLSTALPTWRALLPETRDPRDAPWSRDDGWLLKTALCNTGDTVSVRELMRPGQWLRTRLAAQIWPGSWVAQRRFESLPVSTPIGPRHVCVGVYTVNGRTTGAYTRFSEGPIIDFAASDVALLLEDDD
jgi:glutathionylspermidine synthase